MNVLIIDDTKSISLLVSSVFNQAGHRTVLADCGEKGIECFRKESFDLVVSDIVMPGMDGFETIEHIQKITKEWLPVIFMTTKTADEDLRNGINAGGGFYLAKPIKMLTLESYIMVIEKLISMRDSLKYKADYDELTGLPNRHLLTDRVNIALERAKRNKEKLALYFVDLDNFKKVNDSLGHSAGDKLLQEVAKRLKSCVRDCDTIARLGGDEFVIMLSDVKSDEALEKIAQNILKVLNDPFNLQNMETTLVSGSVGISVYPDDANDIEELLKNSDTAMYQSKENGKNNHCFYSINMGINASKRTAIESGLRRAITNDELELYFQPQVCCNTNQLIGVEALIRWHHPKSGMIMPNEFIPIAEDSCLIMDLGEWVIKTTCKKISEWEAMGYYIPKIAVNISPQQLNEQDFEERVKSLIHQSHINPEYLDFEITESGVMDNPDRAIFILKRLKRLGLTISMDDFGTGYSSMSYLKRLPIDKLKIDREFIKALPNESNDCAITRTVITMGHSMGMKVIAEGVEDTKQLEFLKNEGCDEIQGYIFGKPIPENELKNLLINHGQYHEKKRAS